MKFTWIDYETKYAPIVEIWLDANAKRYTGCDDGWNSFYEYWKNDSDMSLGTNYWSKLICINDMPSAIIAISLYNNVYNVMEYIVNPLIRNKGYGSAALTELLNNGKEIIGNHINQAKAVIFPNNIASQKAFEKSGFIFNRAIDDDAWEYKYRKYGKAMQANTINGTNGKGTGE